MASPDSTRSRTAKTTAKEPRAQLVVKTAGGEVRFEAGLSAVEKRFDSLMDRLFAPGVTGVAARAPAATVTQPAVAMRMVPEQTASPARAPVPAATGNNPAFSLDLAMVAECFSVNAANEISLRGIPRGLKKRERNIDTLLLLLYGKLVLQGQSPVTAPALLRSARQSGIELDRASRLLNQRRAYVRTEGRRRGMRYHLTEAGVGYCETLLQKLHASLAPGRAAPPPAPAGSS
ncbi:MAG: hypothetical protein GY719_05045 [bacterium]|nr:hypothetical protein [bacterium]